MNSAGLKVFRLNASILAPGDIILTRDSGYQSQGIRYGVKGATEEAYSHAILYLGDSYAIEATREGIFGVDPESIRVENNDDMIVLRLKENPSKQSLYAINSWCRGMLAHSYTFTGAIAAGVWQKLGIDIGFTAAWQKLGIGTEPIDGDGQFCSKFVAQAFSVGGIDVFGKAKHQTPTSLICDHVSIIRNVGIAINNSIDDIGFDGSELSIKFSNDLMDSYRSITNGKLKKELTNLGSSDAFAMKYPQFDASMADIFRKSEYKNYMLSYYPKEDFGIIFSNLLKLEENLGQDAALTLAMRSMKTPDAVYNNHIRNASTYSKFIKKNPDSSFIAEKLNFSCRFIELNKRMLSENLTYVYKVSGEDGVIKFNPGSIFLEDLFPDEVGKACLGIREKNGLHLDFLSCLSLVMIDKPEEIKKFNCELEQSGLFLALSSFAKNPLATVPNLQLLNDPKSAFSTCLDVEFVSLKILLNGGDEEFMIKLIKSVGACRNKMFSFYRDEVLKEETRMRIINQFSPLSTSP